MRQQGTPPAEFVLILTVVIVALVLIFAYFRFSRNTNTFSADRDSSVQQNQPSEGGRVAAAQTHVVQPGETLIQIAEQYGLAYADIVGANEITNPDDLKAGQTLIIPNVYGETAAASGEIDLAAILLPDSKLVYGPPGREFNTTQFINRYYAASTLQAHREQVEGRSLDGAAIVQLVAERTRVDPRLLLTALEFKSSWVTQSNNVNVFPLGNAAAGEGLYRQLEWAANQINKGYYGRAEGGVTGFTLQDGGPVEFTADSNFGTSGLLYWLGQSALSQATLAEDGGRFVQLYEQLFGSIYDGADESFYQGNISQPTLRLPWEDGVTWYFTGGPHGGWAAGSAWAALDFAPPGDSSGCAVSNEWLVAVADGVITRSDAGAIVLDLDGDGYAGTGWVVLYQHVATQDRVPVGSRMREGDRIGRASCEGGVSTGTHLHIARTYNGRWISADQGLPFNLGGWESRGDGDEYNGSLVNGDQVRTATVGRFATNAITAP